MLGSLSALSFILWAVFLASSSEPLARLPGALFSRHSSFP